MKIVGWIIAIPVVLFLLFVVARFIFCRPNIFLVNDMEPVAKKISDYIAKNGVSNNLGAIKNLPFKEKDCKRVVKYYKKNGPINTTVKIQGKARKSITEEVCYYSSKGKIYKLYLWMAEHYKPKKSIRGDLSIEIQKTSVGFSFDLNANNKIVPSAISSNIETRTGFCRQFKQ